MTFSGLRVGLILLVALVVGSSRSGLVSPSVLKADEKKQHVYPVCRASLAHRQSLPQDLDLTFTIDRDSYRIGEEIDATITVANYGPSPWTIFRGFTPEHHTPSGYPVSELTFVITDENNRHVSYRGFYEEFSEPASVQAFTPLSCGEFAGIHLSLTGGEFSYALNRPGKYAAQVQLRHIGRHWVEGQLRRSQMKETDLIYDVATIFDGTLLSNRLSFTIR
jgi:hypothetical protein